MAIDSNKVKNFWSSRAKKYGAVPYESVTNLEEKSDLLKLKLQLEREKVFNSITLTKDMSVLDLGAGTGIWSALISHKCENVYAVEYIKEFTEIGRQEMKDAGIENVHFINIPAQDFTSETQYDLIFISGLFVFLNDDEANQLLTNINTYSRAGTTLLLRDGTSILENRYEINNRYSDILGACYSSIYRTAREYIDSFESIHFDLIKDENMFEESCELNKFPETRLRLYIFEKTH